MQPISIQTNLNVNDTQDERRCNSNCKLEKYLNCIIISIMKQQSG